MSSLAWLARIAGAAALVSSVVACEQPTGLVLNVQGLESMDRLYLAVGASPSQNQFEQRRFIHAQDPVTINASEEATIVYAPPFPASFEIFIEDSHHLQSKSELALVLDATSGPLVSPLIRRDSFEVVPDSSALLEVRLTPRDLGPGQWVCWGRVKTTEDPGLVIGASNNADCDRDGWSFNEDPDDADPLRAGTPMWKEEGLLCHVRLGSRILRSDTDCLGSCSFENCIVNKPRSRCRVGSNPATLSVTELMVGAELPDHPEWALTRLGPQEAAAYFEPSERAPDEWSATFRIPGGRRDSWFMLEDRAGTTSRLIVIEMGDDGMPNECKFE